MNISQDDLSELKRLAANTYEQEKSEQIHRIIRESTSLKLGCSSYGREQEVEGSAEA
jgi:hypothetical protein